MVNPILCPPAVSRACRAWVVTNVGFSASAARMVRRCAVATGTDGARRVRRAGAWSGVDGPPCVVSVIVGAPARGESWCVVGRHWGAPVRRRGAGGGAPRRGGTRRRRPP
ncbi:MAG: hypothetical protein V7646_2139 [Pseudonocardia sp.]